MKQVIWMLLLLSNVKAQTQIFSTNHFQTQYYGIRSITQGDVNADGYLDVLVVPGGENRVLMYLNDQNNGFKVKELFIRHDVIQVGLADMTGNNGLDLVVLSYDSSQTAYSGRPFPGSEVHPVHLSVYLNSGVGVFNMDQPYYNYTSVGLPVKAGLLVGDYDQDDRDDIIFTFEQSPFQGLSNLSTNLVTRSNNGYDLSFLDIKVTKNSQLADFNQDGYLDIWNVSDGVEIYIYDPALGFLSDNREYRGLALNETQDPNQLNPPSLSLNQFSLGDVDQDGNLDILGFESGERHRLFLQTEEGFSQVNLNAQLPLMGRQLGGLIDVENNGTLQSWITAEDSETLVLTSGVDETMELVTLSSSPQNRLSKQAITADFTADGFSDFLTVGANGLMLWVNDTQGQFTQHPSKDRYWGFKSDILVHDINKDTDVDLLLYGKDGVAIKTGLGNGTFNALSPISFQPVENLLAVDVDADEKIELLGMNQGTVYQWKNTSANEYEETVLLSTSNRHARRLSAYDFDQDQDVDFVYLDEHGQLVVLENLDGTLRPSELTYPQSLVDFVVMPAQAQQPTKLVAFSDRTSPLPPGIKVINFSREQGFTTELSIAYDDIPNAVGYQGIVYGQLTMGGFDMDLDGDQDVVIPYIDTDRQGLVWLSQEEAGWQVHTLPNGESDLLPWARDFADINQDGFLDVLGSELLFNLIDFSLAEPADQLSLGSEDGLQEAQYLRHDIQTSQAILVDLDHDSDLDLVQIGLSLDWATQINTTVDIDFSGHWFDPEQDGHGLVLQQIDSAGVPSVLMSWFAYHEGQPFWLIGVAPINDGLVEIQASYGTGTGFGDLFNENDVERIHWGTVSLTWVDHNQIDVSWNPDKTGFESGQMSMQKLTGIKPAAPANNLLTSCHSGAWYNPGQDGHGLFVELISVEEEDRMLVAWYHYFDGSPHWSIAQGPVLGRQAFLTLNQYAGGFFPPEFNSEDVSLTASGFMNFELLSDHKAKLSWSNISEEFANGSLELEKLTQIDRYSCDY